jgi:hypothetical protein
MNQGGIALDLLKQMPGRQRKVKLSKNLRSDLINTQRRLAESTLIRVTLMRDGLRIT